MWNHMYISLLTKATFSLAFPVLLSYYVVIPRVEEKMNRCFWGYPAQQGAPPVPWKYVQKKNYGEDSLLNFLFVGPIPRPISGTATTLRPECTWHFEWPRKNLLPLGKNHSKATAFSAKQELFFKTVSPFGIDQLVACMSTPCRLYTCHPNMWQCFIYTHHTIQEHVTQWPWPQ